MMKPNFNNRNYLNETSTLTVKLSATSPTLIIVYLSICVCQSRHLAAKKITAPFSLRVSKLPYTAGRKSEDISERGRVVERCKERKKEIQDIYRDTPLLR